MKSYIGCCGQKLTPTPNKNRMASEEFVAHGGNPPN
jgi:hypothetical protein